MMSNLVALDRVRRIRLLNDNFRTTFIGGQVVMTAGVADMPLDVKARVMLQVQRFANFDADNDPHREHDFGSFEPPRVCRRPFGLSHAAMACCSRLV
jgi:hypothetical protein